MNKTLLIGLVLSIAINGAALYSSGVYTPAEPRFDAGRTVVQLTLMPSISSQAAAPPPDVSADPAEAAEPVTAAVPAALSLPLPVPVQNEIPTAQPAVTAESQSIDSAEQDASLTEDKGVITEASSTTSIQPGYPRVSRVRGEEGVVTLSVQVLPSGKTGRIDVLQSSGYRRLDEAAYKAAHRASFTPARQFGRDIESTKELSITFRLTHD